MEKLMIGAPTDTKVDPNEQQLLQNKNFLDLISRGTYVAKLEQRPNNHYLEFKTNDEKQKFLSFLKEQNPGIQLSSASTVNNETQRLSCRDSGYPDKFLVEISPKLVEVLNKITIPQDVITDYEILFKYNDNRLGRDPDTARELAKFLMGEAVLWQSDSNKLCVTHFVRDSNNQDCLNHFYFTWDGNNKVFFDEKGNKGKEIYSILAQDDYQDLNFTKDSQDQVRLMNARNELQRSQALLMSGGPSSLRRSSEQSLIQEREEKSESLMIKLK